MFTNPRFFATTIKKDDENVAMPAKRPRGRPRKVVEPLISEVDSNKIPEQPVKKPRGRPRKVVEEVPATNSNDLKTPEPVKKRGRPRKVVEPAIAATTDAIDN